MKFSVERFFVKICGVTSEEDALMSIGFGANAVGFIFAPSVRQVTPTQVHDILRRLPPEIISVGVFRNESPQRVVEIANTIGLDAVQLHGSESEETAQYVAQRVRTVIRALPASSDRIRQFDLEGHDYLLLDGDTPGSGMAHGWDVFDRHVFRTPVIASGGLTPSNVGPVVANYPVWGVDVSSGVESAPGIKDPGLVADFVSNARWAAETRPEDFDDRPFDWSEQ